MMEDERFKHILNDPKYRRIPKSERKVKIDGRFKSMFKDKKFKVKYTVDKRGRPVGHTSSEDLKRYYELNSNESATSEESETEEQHNKSGKYVKAPSEDDQLNEKLESDKQVTEDVKQKLKNLNIDYARGESNLFSESSSDDEEESEEDEDDTLQHEWGALDNDAERTDEITHRLAACNMDWDRIKAMDLMVLLSSFLPSDGFIKSVKVYPSEFGKERLKEEEIKGPVELVESKPLQSDEESEEIGEEGSKFHMEKLRQYQLNRLKYYYAVIDCSTKNAANKIYSECDGLEYESSATKIDLRFIPDDMTFDEQPKEVCEKLPEQGKYKPRLFTTTALQQAKVDLTWDETNPDRIEFTQKLAAGNEVEKGDLDAYLASSSDEDEEKTTEADDSNDPVSNGKLSTIDKYKSLLQDIENKEKEKENQRVEMEVTWDIDLKDKTENLVKKKLSEIEEKTPFQLYLDKRKEKQKAKREERKKKNISDEEDNDYSDIPSDIDMNDSYFAEEFDKPEFKQKNMKNTNKQVNKDDKQAAAELELLLLNTEDNKNHFNLKEIQAREQESKSKKKLKKQKEVAKDVGDNFKINVEDSRFSALYTSHHYNIDPTDPHYKKTKAMEAIVNEKLKRRDDSIKEDDFSNLSKEHVELNTLVKSVKRKSEALGTRKKCKTN